MRLHTVRRNWMFLRVQALSAQRDPWCARVGGEAVEPGSAAAGVFAGIEQADPQASGPGVAGFGPVHGRPAAARLAIAGPGWAMTQFGGDDLGQMPGAGKARGAGAVAR